MPVGIPTTLSLLRRSGVALVFACAVSAVSPPAAHAQPPLETEEEAVDDPEVPTDAEIDEEPVAPVAEDLFEEEETDDVVEPPPDHVAPGDEDSLSHENQVGIRIGAAIPFVFAIRYGEGPKCAAGPETFCRRLGVGLLDVDLSFGFSRSLEVTVLGRIGLADDEAAGAMPFVLGLGLRGFVSADDMVKVYAGGRLILDITAADEAINPDWSTLDVGLRGEFGVAFDFIRYFGAYVQIGVNLQVLRGLYLIADASAGLQARFP